MSDREKAERIAERHMGAVSKAWAANLAIDIEDALTTARRESPAAWRKEPPTAEEVKACEWWWCDDGDPRPMRLTVNQFGRVVEVVDGHEIPVEEMEAEWALRVMPGGAGLVEAARPVASVEGVVVRHHLNGAPYVAVNVALPEDVGEVGRAVRVRFRLVAGVSFAVGGCSSARTAGESDTTVGDGMPGGIVVVA